jgi:hypothetical protein
LRRALRASDVLAPADLKLRTQVGPVVRSRPRYAHAVLRDPDGTVQAYGSKDGERYRVHFPGLADFSFRPGCSDVIAHVGDSSELVDDLFRTAVLPLALQVSGYEVLHASAVRTPRGVAAFCGMSGMGKSTVAYGLSRRGYPLWADDAVVFSAADDRTTRCFRIPFALHLREASREYFAAPATEIAGVDSRRETSELTAIVVLERVVAATPTVEPMSIAAAMRELLPHAYRFTLADRARAKRTVESYLDVAARVPVFSARYAPGFVQLPALLDAIERAVTNTRPGT